MLRNPFARRPAPSAPASLTRTYADVVEVMRYDRGMDVMPFAIAYRLKPPFVDPSGPEPNIALLDAEAEIDAFMEVLHSPIILGDRGKPAWPPLHQWNETPSGLMAEPFIAAFYHPDDENAGWPELIISAYSPTMLARGAHDVGELARGRYAFEQFQPGGKRAYVEKLAALDIKGPLLFIDGKLPFSLVEMLNPRKPDGSDQ